MNYISPYLNKIHSVFTQIPHAEDTGQILRKNKILVLQAIAAAIFATSPIATGFFIGITLIAINSGEVESRYRPFTERTVALIQPVYQREPNAFELISILGMIALNDTTRSIASFGVGLNLGILIGNALFKSNG